MFSFVIRYQVDDNRFNQIKINKIIIIKKLEPTRIKDWNHNMQMEFIA